MDEMLKVIIPRDWIDIIIPKLLTMNISYATLFLGLDGFSMSMGELLWSAEYVNINETKIDNDKRL